MKPFSIRKPAGAGIVLNSSRSNHYLYLFTFCFTAGGFMFSGISSCTGKKNPAESKPVETQNIKISFEQKGGPFLILGPNPGGIWAPNKDRGYWWNQMNINIENNCEKAVYIDPANIQLYISVKPETNNAGHFSPTTLGKQYLVNPLKTGWLKPGELATGNLVFEVPEQLPDGTAANGAYKLIRLTLQNIPGNCSMVYTPY